MWIAFQSKLISVVYRSQRDSVDDTEKEVEGERERELEGHNPDRADLCMKKIPT